MRVLGRWSPRAHFGMDRLLRSLGRRSSPWVLAGIWPLGAIGPFALCSCTPINPLSSSESANLGDSGVTGTPGVNRGDGSVTPPQGAHDAQVPADESVETPGQRRQPQGDSTGTTGGPPSSDGGSAPPDPAAPPQDSGDLMDLQDQPVSMEPLDPSLRYVAPELADETALAALEDILQAPILGTGKFKQDSSAERSDGAPRGLRQPFAYGNGDCNNFVCRSDTAHVADPASGSAPHHYDMPSCSEDYVRGVVLAHRHGSGRMTRLFLSHDALFSEGDTSEQLVRVYVDDNPRAVLQMPLLQLVTGGGGEIFGLPFGAASEAFAAWYYPVVFGTKLIVAVDNLTADNFFYQVDTVLDAPELKRVAARSRLAGRENASRILSRATSSVPDASSIRSEQFALPPGGQRTVMLSGPHTISELRLRVPADGIAALQAVHVAVNWDNGVQAAIDLGLLELFGATQSAPERGSLVLEAALRDGNQTFSLRLPMPFSHGSTWTISNGGNNESGFQLEWIGVPSVPEQPFGHLAVQVNAPALPRSGQGESVALAVAEGRGRFVGTCVDLGGRADPALGAYAHYLNLLEGDFRAHVDGDEVLHTTGTGDYADNAGYFAESPRGSPFAQSWAKVESAGSTPQGQISFCRWHVLGNEIDFQRSFRLTHELGQYDASVVERHHSVAYLYLQ